MKEVDDATFIRSRLLLSFERAELETDPEKRAAHLSFVIIGGGPTGVELAGAIKELAVDVIPRDFRVADTRRARVMLIEAGPAAVAGVSCRSSSQRALKQLQALGVEVRLGSPVTDMCSRTAWRSAASGCAVFNVIWAAGVRASPLVQTLGAEHGPGGRVKVHAGLLGPRPPECIRHRRRGVAGGLEDRQSRCRASRRARCRWARYAAKVIHGGDSRRRAEPSCASAASTTWTSAPWRRSGKSRAVVEIGRLRFGGLLAWFAWLGLHITVLIGFRNRLAVLSSGSTATCSSGAARA